MATGRITKRSVEGVPVPTGTKRNYLWDDQLKGFGVMVTPAGSRSYLIQYRIGGRGKPTRRYTIGKHGSPWTAEKAKERAADLLELVRKRVDPLEEDRVRLSAAAEARKDAERFAFATYVDVFLVRHVLARKLRSADDIKAVFRRDLTPHFKQKAISSIRRGDVQACLDELEERSGSAANKAHKWLRKLFSFAVARGDLATSPMQGMTPPHADGKRKRVLNADELSVIWKASSNLGHPWTALIQLLMLTGQRLREVAGMTWAEIDVAKLQWIIPGARTKNKRDHLVPLSNFAVTILTSIEPSPKARKGLVLSTNNKTPVSGFSKCKKSLDREIQKLLADSGAEKDDAPLSMAPWVLHDLRRSLATGCQSLGFPIEHTEAVLNHVSGKRGGLAAIYQLHEYEGEKRTALNAWALHVAAYVEDGNLLQTDASA